jgi:site-specific recombinase XerD
MSLVHRKPRLENISSLPKSGLEPMTAEQRHAVQQANIAKRGQSTVASYAAATEHGPATNPRQRELKQRSLNRKWDIPEEKTPFRDVTSGFLRRCERVRNSMRTRENYFFNLNSRLFRYLEKELHYQFWEEVTYGDMAEAIRILQNSTLSESSKQQFLRVLRTFLNWLREDPEFKHAYLVDFLPLIPSMPNAPRRIWIPEPEEMKEFLDRFDRKTFWGLRDATITSLVLDCGARAGEVCNLQPDFIHSQTSTVTLKGKGRNSEKEREVPVSKEVLDLLHKWMRHRDRIAKGSGQNRVFISRNGGALTPHALDQSFTKHRRATGLGTHAEGQITPHVLRHFFCTYYLVNGGTLPMLQQITGHTSLATLMIYVHMARMLTHVADESRKASPLTNLAKVGRKTRKMY